MIIEGLLQVIFNTVNLLLSPLDVLSFVFDSSIMNTVGEYLSIVFYFIPIGNLMPIILFIIALFGFRSLLALLKTIMQLIPFV